MLLPALFGFLGAKIFHNLENWDDFIADPIDALLSFSGLTMYGGLILASAALIYYGHKNKIKDAKRMFHCSHLLRYHLILFPFVAPFFKF